MKIQFSLTQKNKKGGQSFRFVKDSEIKGHNLVKAAAEIAEFTRDIIELVEKNKATGYAAAYNGLKKSLPLTLKIQGGNQEPVELSYKSYGKFAHEATQKQIEEFLTNNITFVQKWGNK